MVSPFGRDGLNWTHKYSVCIEKADVDLKYNVEGTSTSVEDTTDGFNMQ